MTLLKPSRGARWAMAVTVTALTSTLGASMATAAEPPPGKTATASVMGSARLHYYSPRDDVRFAVNAHAIYSKPADYPFPTKAWGTARISHHFPDAKPKPITFWAEVAVDCLITGGRTATVTGIVVAASPNIKDWKKRKIRLGFSVYDGGKGGPDRAGFSGPTEKGQPKLQKCMAPAAYFPVKHGNYTVKDAGLLPARTN